MVKNLEYELTVNGTKRKVVANPMTRLLDVLRYEMKLTGTKEGCGEGECGACAVEINGKLMNSCLVPIAAAADSTITTIENRNDAILQRLQKCFADHNGAQCGICTPGMILAARDLLKANSSPSRDQIKQAISGNLCRCTGYTRIIDAIEAAAVNC